MPLRGETIGAAYVRIIASGEGFPESVKRMFDENEKVFKAGGKHNAKSYDEEFEKELKNFGKGFDKALTNGLNRSTAIEDALTGKKWERLKRRIEVNYGGLGDIISNELAKSIRESQDISSTFINSRLKKIGRDVLAAQKTLRAGIEAEAKAEEASVAKAAMERIKWDMKITRSHIAAIEEDRRRTERALKSVGHDADKVATDIEHGFRSSLVRTGDWLDVFGNKFGRAFGAGARNNALNLFGRSMQGVVETLARIPKVIDFIAGAFGKVTSALGDSEKVFAGVEQGGTNIADFGASLGKFAASGTAAAAVIAILITGLGVLTSVISGLLAAITALAASITFGLIGALAPLVGLIAPLALALGTLVLGFKSLSAENKVNQKNLTAATTAVNTAKKAVEAATPGTKKHADAVNKLNAALREQAAAQKAVNDEFGNQVGKVKSAFKELEGIAGKSLLKGLIPAVHDLVPALKSFAPVIRVVADALGQVAAIFAHALVGPEFQNFLIVMSKFAPKAIIALGTIFTNVFTAIGGIFVALAPVTAQFLDVILNISKEFTDKVNSPKGQNHLKKFFSDAWDSAKILWGLISSIGDVIGTLFTAGKGTGDNIITELTNNINTFNDTLKKDGGKSLKAWFANGKDTIDNIGLIAKDIAGLFQLLDSPTNRTAAKITLGTIDLVLQGLIVTAHAATWAINGFIGGIKTFGTTIGVITSGVKIAWSGMGALMKTGLLDLELSIALWAQRVVTLADKALGWIPALGPKLKDAKAAVDSWVNHVRGQIADLHPSFVITGTLKINIDAINHAHLSPQAVAKALEFAWNARALGGPVIAGMPYKVGERGTELFVPDQNGMILPANDPATRAFARQTSTTNTTMSTTSNVNRTWGDINIYTPTENPRAVAAEVVNKLSALAI